MNLQFFTSSNETGQATKEMSMYTSVKIKFKIIPITIRLLVIKKCTSHVNVDTS